MSALRWYRCRCKRAMVGIDRTNTGFQIVEHVKCTAGKCSSCQQSVADFKFQKDITGPVAPKRNKIQRAER